MDNASDYVVKRMWMWMWVYGILYRERERERVLGEVGLGLRGDGKCKKGMEKSGGCFE